MSRVCPVCGSERTSLAYGLIACDLHRCADCSHLFTVLHDGVEAEAYGDDYYLERHRDYFEHPDTALFARALTVLERYWKPGGRVVDVGCGTGNWLAFLREHGYTSVGVETSEAAAEVARARGLDVACIAVDDYAPEAPFDGSISWYVLEHIDEIDAFIAASARLLAPGGVGVFATVDSGAMVYKLGKLLHRATLGRFRSPLQRICEIHHVQHFSRRSLDTVLEQNGLAVVDRFSAPFPVRSVNTSALQRLLLRIAYAMAEPFDDHFIQVVIARRAEDLPST